MSATVIRRNYTNLLGRELNLEQPTTFSEKLCRRSLQLEADSDDRLSPYADKLAVRDYIRRQVGERYVVPVLWQGTDPKAIPFDTLPFPSVLKANHGSTQVVVLREDTDRVATIKKARSWLRHSYYWWAREYQYLAIPRRLFVEEFIDDGHTDGPRDYKIFCFHGTPALIQVDNTLKNINPFFDVDWQRVDLSYRMTMRAIDIPRPDNLAEMLRVAAALSAPFSFVRVDLYNAHGRIYVGELTFTPGGGFLKFNSTEWEERLGQLWLDAPPHAETLHYPL